MKLSLPRLAARRGVGGSLHPVVLHEQARYSPSSFRTQPLPSYQPSQCTRRQLSNATASPKPEAPETPSEATSQAPSSTPISQTPSKPPLSDQVRLLMRRVPYPVAIITATDPSGPQDTTSFRGMTVSSFNTVTLTPHPVLSFNVRRPSETLNALLASGRFLVHLLAPGPATATLARDFSKGNTTLAAMLSGHGEFEFAAWRASAETKDSDGEGEVGRPLPILRRKLDGRSDDFPFVFECTLHPQKIDVHDHSIVLGTVVRAIEGSNSSNPEQSGAGDEHSPDALCLTYANTKFWKMGGEI